MLRNMEVAAPFAVVLFFSCAMDGITVMLLEIGMAHDVFTLDKLCRLLQPDSLYIAPHIHIE